MNFIDPFTQEQIRIEADVRLSRARVIANFAVAGGLGAAFITFALSRSSLYGEMREMAGQKELLAQGCE